MVSKDIQLEHDLLSNQDWKMILDSLRYTRLKFEDYEGFPSHEYKLQRIEEVADLSSRIQKLLKS